MPIVHENSNRSNYKSLVILSCSVARNRRSVHKTFLDEYRKRRREELFQSIHNGDKGNVYPYVGGLLYLQNKKINIHMLS